MYAYDQNLLYKARISLARMFDYAVNDFGMKLDVFYAAFLNSRYSKMFASGDSKVVAGMSGTELAYEVIQEVLPACELPKPSLRLDRTPEFWLGHSLAYYQWEKGIGFTLITRNLSINDIMDLYSKYHEVDIKHFVIRLDEMRGCDAEERRLKRLRMYAELSQRQLSLLSDVPLRTIQQYEQGQKDIKRASYETVAAISRALYCESQELI